MHTYIHAYVYSSSCRRSAPTISMSPSPLSLQGLPLYLHSFFSPAPLLSPSLPPQPYPTSSFHFQELSCHLPGFFLHPFWLLGFTPSLPPSLSLSSPYLHSSPVHPNSIFHIPLSFSHTFSIARYPFLTLALSATLITLSLTLSLSHSLSLSLWDSLSLLFWFCLLPCPCASLYPLPSIRSPLHSSVSLYTLYTPTQSCFLFSLPSPFLVSLNGNPAPTETHSSAVCVSVYLSRMSL